MNPKFTSIYTGQTVESAIAKALQLDTFEHISDEVINGTVFHVLWKTKPTATNQVSGVAVHPSGRVYDITSVNGVLSAYGYISESDVISTSEIDSLFNN